MIFLVVEYGEGAVELLCEEESHHLVVERHLGQREFVMRRLVNIFNLDTYSSRPAFT